jgi:hypothetical protein
VFFPSRALQVPQTGSRNIPFHADCSLLATSTLSKNNEIKNFSFRDFGNLFMTNFPQCFNLCRFLLGSWFLCQTLNFSLEHNRMCAASVFSIFASRSTHFFPPLFIVLSIFIRGAWCGLKYDIEKGLLLKLDSFLQIQLGTVYRGLTPVPDDEVLRIYRNRIIPVKYVEGDRQTVRTTTTTRLHCGTSFLTTFLLQHNNSRKMIQLADLFSVPEMYLLSTVTDFFHRHHIDYHPEILFRDVQVSLRENLMKFAPDDRR